ncbi:carbohydrate ABC transporter permease [Fodinicurvata halophila]|uniref:Carbohydrate ABC transporter permease n=1 Tax=Fodinicurvata halophila TaxID=1419723 RepID=A0ABV8UG75_9PROT
MAAPAVGLLFIVTIVPLLFSLGVSLTNLQYGTPAPLAFEGLGNYVRALTADSRFINAMLNTAILLFGGLALQITLGYLIASLLFRLERGRTLILSLLLIPSIVSQVVAGWQGRLIFNATSGPLNALLTMIGIDGPSWLATTDTALLTILLTDTWQWTPFMTLIMLAALQGIPQDILEAATLDGAYGWSLFRLVILPLILPIAAIGILLRSVDIFKTFDLVYILTQGGPGNSSETLTYYTYLQGFKFFSPGYAAALTFIQLIIVVIAAKLFLRFVARQTGQEK